MNAFLGIISGICFFVVAIPLLGVILLMSPAILVIWAALYAILFIYRLYDPDGCDKLEEHLNKGGD